MSNTSHDLDYLDCAQEILGLNGVPVASGTHRHPQPDLTGTHRKEFSVKIATNLAWPVQPCSSLPPKKSTHTMFVVLLR